MIRNSKGNINWLFACHKLGISEGPVKYLGGGCGIGENEDIHSSVAMTTQKIIDDQEEWDFFWDVRFEGINPAHRWEKVASCTVRGLCGSVFLNCLSWPICGL